MWRIRMRRRRPLAGAALVALLLSGGCAAPGDDEPAAGGEDGPAAPAGGGAGAGTASVLDVTDETPEENPCPEPEGEDDDEDAVDVSQFEYDSLRRIIAEILGDDAGIVADVEAQIRRVVPDDDEAEVKVTISVCSQEEFRREYVEEKGGPDATDEEKARLEREADERYESLAGFTYTTGERTIRIKIFCKKGLMHNPFDSAQVKRLRELVIHELVHAKLFAMEQLGVAEGDLPFQNHPPAGEDNGTGDFYDEIARLLGLLTTEVPPMEEEPGEEQPAEEDAPPEEEAPGDGG